MVVTMIIRGISRQHQLHRRISVTSCSGLFSPRICRTMSDFFEGDLQIGFSASSIKSPIWFSVDFVLLGSPQWHHGGCVFCRLWLVNGERKCEEATAIFPARGRNGFCVI